MAFNRPESNLMSLCSVILADIPPLFLTIKVGAPYWICVVIDDRIASLRPIFAKVYGWMPCFQCTKTSLCKIFWLYFAATGKLIWTVSV